MKPLISVALLLVAAAGIPSCLGQLVWVNDCSATFKLGLQENVPVGTRLCTLAATYNNNSARVTYEAVSDNFNVNTTTGVLSMARIIDRETIDPASRDTVLLTVRARYNPASLSIEAAITITILDVNDNQPQFEGQPYSASVSEAAPNGTVFYSGIVATDSDAGTNAELTLSCINCAKFHLFQTRLAANRYQGSLMLVEPVDYEQDTYYIVTVLAKDSSATNPLNRTVNVIVTIGDAQDTPPVFRDRYISFTITENNTVVSALGYVEARDGDGGDNLGRPVVLDIVNDPIGAFLFRATLDPLLSSVYYRGELVLKPGAVLDREAWYGNFYSFNISATEIYSKSNTTKTDAVRQNAVEIIVIDINDNIPAFVDGPIFNVTTPENLANLSVIGGLDILVRDADGTSRYNTMNVSVQSSTYANVFAITPSTVVGQGTCNLLVMDSTKLDYEVPAYREHEVVLLLQEAGTTEKFSSSATIYIRLTDINDNAPTFGGNSSFFQFSVLEIRPVGWLVGHVRATDRDSGLLGEVTHSLSGSNADKLSINATTGQLNLAKPLNYDIEKEFSVTVIATDGGGLSSAAVVYINVQDYNDKAPYFSQDRYTATINEQSTILIPPLVLKTNDTDTTVPIKFSIISGNTPDNGFRIVNQNSSLLNGELIITRSGGFNFTDTPSGTFGRFILHVLAQDEGDPPLNATTIVEISLRDINNNPPIFNPKNYSAVIKETTAEGTIIATLTATDADIDAETNKRITYQLQSGSVEKFTINSLTGELSVARTNNFDINREGSLFYVQVVARDNGAPTQSDVASVYVTVLDANNKNPFFFQPLYIFQIVEDTPIGSLVGFVNASDQDSNARLEFTVNPTSITAMNPFSIPVTSRAPFDYLAAFQMNSSGFITTQLVMNRDAVAQVQMVAVVRDLNAELPPIQTATSTVVIQITQRSSRSPVFSAPWSVSSPQILVPMPEGLPVGTTIITLVASDPSTNEKVTNFRVIPGSDSESAFTLDSRTGTLTLNKVLDYENRINKRLSVIVEARTSANTTALCTVYVIIEDINDNPPVFLSSSYAFLVSEDTRYPQEFGLVVATDADSGDYGTLRYSLRGTGSELFFLDPVFGTIRPAPGVTLDREAKSQFDFLVRATDNPTASTAATQRYTDVPLTVTLTDVNDNAPTFTNPTFEVSIFENIPAGSVIITLTASDPDSGVNGIVGFAIRSGNELGYFGLNPTTGALRVSTSLLGKPSRSYVLSVTATDGGTPPQSTEHRLTVTVRSVSETRGNPVVTYPIEGRSYATVEEAPIGTPILQVTARDPDSSGENMTFLLGGTDASKFAINASTGWISSRVRLDREAQATYQLVAFVRDGSGLETLAPVLFAISLTDINDNPPVFAGCNLQYNTQPVPVVVPENVYNREINTFTACDPDISPNNGLTYRITCGNEAGYFAVGRDTGVLSVVKPIDREARSQYLLCLMANSTLPVVPPGSASPANQSQLMVLVNVQDEDDNGPTAESAVQIAYLASDVIYNTQVTTLAVTDPDLPSNWNHVYSVQRSVFTSADRSKVNSPADGAFRVDSSAGVLRSGFLNYASYIGGTFDVDVLVSDSRSRTARVNVRVNILGEENRLRYVVSMTPVQALGVAQQLIDNVTAMVRSSGLTLTFQRVSLHATTASGAEQNTADVCFAVAGSESQILTLRQAKATLDKGVSSSLDSLYSEFKVQSIGYCNSYSLFKTYNYLGIEGYWWLFTAMSAIIIPFALGLVGFMMVLYNKYETMCTALQYQ
ncbi:hypothetical protein BOX15_Mlig014351g1 [Macrostomum lignano]|uniref:Cadherin domain-containing protein n=1 Tax=Macrostomum lignano TaxID=282301 RepID=A0A267DQ59_9PLAT|nr:hypothetical protein BOX15_Mlig014351g1 [Macrostomum lignano]